jgi:putative PEP-CTERM system TPR-repeat lipoprotein
MLALGSLEQAESYARQLIKTAPSLPNGPQLLAAILLKKGAADQALQVIEPMLDTGSNDAQLFTMAGEAALRSGNAKASEEYFARAAKLDSKDPRKRVGLALARLGTGNRAGAVADLEAASAMSGELTDADQILIATALRNREFDRALASIERLERKHPESGEGSYLRGRVALAQGDVAGARSQFEQALKMNPSLLPAVSSLAALDVKEGKTLEAKRRYEVVVKDNPKNASALLALANLTTETGGTPKESLDLLKRATDADPNNEAATLSLAQGMIAHGQAREAIQVLQQAARNHPDWVRVPEALAVAHIRAGEPARAHEVIDNFGKRKRDDAGVQYRLGSLKTALKDHAGALEYFQRAQALQPTAVEPRVNIAMSQARLGRFEEAVGTARQLQSELKDAPVGWMLEGEVHWSGQKWREAATAFRRAHDIDPSQQAIALKLHDSLARAGSKDEAERLLQGWLKASPKDEKLNLYAGERALLDKRYAESVRYYEAAVAVNPGNGSAYNNLAWALHQLKDPKALPAAEKAYQIAPKSAAVVDTLATILSDTSQVQRGLEMHRQAAALAPRSPELRLKLGRALKNTGDKDGARQELDAVVRDFPGTPQATAARQLSAEL